jgi:hypothetical protein
VILEAFIASQLIGARREAVEARARERYTYEDDMLYVKTIAIIIFFIVGPFIWPIGVFYNSDLRKNSWLYIPYGFAIFFSFFGIIFYWTIGLLWVIYSLCTLHIYVERWRKKKFDEARASADDDEDEILYDGEADVIVEMTVCECGCGEQAKKFTLKPR